MNTTLSSPRPLKDVQTQAEAESWLAGWGQRMLVWALEVGHDASKEVVPAWARPAKIAPAGSADIAKVSGTPSGPGSGLLFDLPEVRKMKSRPKPKTRRERKALADAWGPVGRPR